MINVLAQRTAKYSQRWLNRHFGHLLQKDTYYFGYGANIDEESLNRKYIYPKLSCNGILKNHGVSIILPCEYGGKGYASVLKKDGDEVHGKLHKISYFELLMFDILEWVPFNFYYRQKVTIETKELGHIRAWVYLAKTPNFGLKTSLRYREVLVNAATKYQFPESYIEKLNQLPVGSEFYLDPSFRMSNPAKKRLFHTRLTRLYLFHDKLREKLCAKLP